MQWILLICAGLLEIGWPLGFKLAGLHEKYFYHFIALSVVSMGLSGFLLYLAQKSIPIGTAYVIWTAFSLLDRGRRCPFPVRSGRGTACVT